MQPEKRVSSRAPVVRAALDVRSLLAPIMAMGCERKTPVPGRGTIKPFRAGLARTYVDSGRGGACDGLH